MSFCWDSLSSRCHLSVACDERGMGKNWKGSWRLSSFTEEGRAKGGGEYFFHTKTKEKTIHWLGRKLNDRWRWHRFLRQDKLISKSFVMLINYTVDASILRACRETNDTRNVKLWMSSIIQSGWLWVVFQLSSSIGQNSNLINSNSGATIWLMKCEQKKSAKSYLSTLLETKT